MSPRPRTTSDHDLLSAAERALERLGPARLTLADVAREAAISPAALVQRFGSRRGLLLALAARNAGGVAGRFARARREHASPLDALLNALAAPTAGATTPQSTANQLAFLHLHLYDDDFRAHALEQARATLAGIRALLDAAVAAGELAPCDTDDLSRTVQTAHTGALSTWAVYRSGTLDDWLRGEVEAVLEPYRPTG